MFSWVQNDDLHLTYYLVNLHDTFVLDETLLGNIHIFRASLLFYYVIGTT